MIFVKYNIPERFIILCYDGSRMSGDDLIRCHTNIIILNCAGQNVLTP